MSFKISSLALAVATLSTVSIANAAGLDRSTQPSWAFTEQGTFAYVEHITIAPKVEGKDNKNVATTDANFAAGRNVPDMAEDYQFLNFGAKADVNDTISVGAYFDQPWAADVEFSGDNNFVGAPTAVIGGIYAQAAAGLQNAGIPLPVTNAAELQTAISTIQNQVTVGQARLDAANTQLAQAQAALAANPALAPVLTPQITALQQGIAAGTTQVNAGRAAITNLSTAQAVTNNLSNVTGGTNVSISSQNFTGLLGVKLGEKKNIQIYGGPTIQRLEGDVHLRGNAYKTASGYDANITRDTAYGWMAGIAYLKPEIALKAALTYRSEIDHDVTLTENLPALGAAGVGTNEITVTTPKSVNLDFQTGLNPTTLLTAKARWVPWSDFAIKPTIYGKASGLNLVSYDDDAWTAEVGLGKKLSPQLAISGAVGYDSGAGNPITSLGPVEGNWNVGLGAKYNLTPEWAVSGGVKYLMFGDAKAKLPDGSIVGDFQDNDGWVYGVRLSYQKK
ncbi:outer membrane protein transport protein [Moraxella osloensis]|uniref:outer membrane protein transport protein n=1 Tax=Faucicola osloensis TaxID=34062 RepID=UPI0020056E1F|nr:outer membrane protein transport protein [Moraxella osloensis]MCK6157258.1 outer membrane protein transport protein [Moraxella osloensis]